MKKIILSIITILTISIGLNAQNVNIPDANFKAYLVGNSSINTNNDTAIQVSEANVFTGSINCNALSISDLTGIEAFTNITGLSCANNQIGSLDLSSNTLIESVDCYVNQLTSLDVSNNPNLETLYCYDNQLINLNLSSNSSLIFLSCGDNQLTALNLANGNNTNMDGAANPSLYALNNPNLTCIQIDAGYTPNSFDWRVDAIASYSTSCAVQTCTVNIPDVNFKAYLVGNAAINTNGNTEIECSEATAFNGQINCNTSTISNLTGVEAFTALTKLYCYNNQITSLDVSANTALTHIVCYGNQLTNLDLSANTALEYLNYNNNQITSLDVSANTALEYLFCNNNQISSIDLSNNTALLKLACTTNQLTSLDLSTNTAIFDMNCSVNQLTNLDLSNNTALTKVYCGDNQITALDVSAQTILENLFCNSNQLTSLNVANTNNVNMLNMFADNNPNLTCIEVDDVAYSTTNWTNVDSTSRFSTNCGLVYTITVQGESGDSTITTNGGTLQMEAIVLPINADDATYTWSVVNGTGSATISATGLLTASTDGTVEVIATANDGSDITGTKVITISTPSDNPGTGTGINDLAFENISVYPNPTNGMVNLNISESLSSIRIMDLTGKTIQVFNAESTQLDISNFTAGIYFLEIANAERKSIVKIVKK